MLSQGSAIVHFLLEVDMNGEYDFNSSILGQQELEAYSPNIGEIEVRTKSRSLKIIRVHNRRVEVTHDCDRQIFVRIDASKKILLSSNPELIFSDAQLFNTDYFAKFILGGALPTSASPFNEIHFLSPGTFINADNLEVDFARTKKPIERTFIDALNANIKEKISSHSRIAIEYSGGLESSILLASVAHSGYRGSLELIHATDTESGESDDLERVVAAASKYDATLNIIDQRDFPPFEITHPLVRPHFPHAGLVNQGYIDSVIQKYGSERVLILNGSGGDSLFRSFPQNWLHLELLRAGKPLQAAKWLQQLSKYARTPIAPILSRTWLNYLTAKSMVSDPGFHFSRKALMEKIILPEFIPESFLLRTPLLEENTEISRHERYIDALVNRHEMLSSPVSALPGKCYFPFLTSDAIQAALSIPSDKLLNDGVDRFELRVQATKKYSTNSFWNLRKGSFSGLTQRAIKRNRNAIEELIVNGEFGRIVDTDKVRKIIAGVASGVSLCPSFIINLYAANIFALQWRGRVLGAY